MGSSRSATLTLQGDTEILITREFSAPKELVYEAITTPELVKRWWNAKRGEVTTADIDLRVGGRWRYVMVLPDGMEVAFHGEFREIVPKERVVSTEAFEGIPDPDDNATVNTVTLTETDNGTTMSVHIQCPSSEVRDAIVASGMEDGMQDAYDLLEEVALSLR